MNNMFLLALETGNDRMRNYRFPSTVLANDLALIVINEVAVYAKICDGSEAVTTAMVYGMEDRYGGFIATGPPSGWTVIGIRVPPIETCPTCGKVK